VRLRRGLRAPPGSGPGACATRALRRDRTPRGRAGRAAAVARADTVRRSPRAWCRERVRLRGQPPGAYRRSAGSDATGSRPRAQRTARVLLPAAGARWGRPVPSRWRPRRCLPCRCASPSGGASSRRSTGASIACATTARRWTQRSRAASAARSTCRRWRPSCPDRSPRALTEPDRDLASRPSPTTLI